MPKVSLRGGFSDRSGIKPESTEIQVKGFDKRTRIQLLNMIKSMYFSMYGKNSSVVDVYCRKFVEFFIGAIYSEPFDPNGYYDAQFVFRYLDETFEEGTYDDILTLIEALIGFWDSQLKNNSSGGYYDRQGKRYKHPSFFEIANENFKNEYVGYRFVDNIIVPISNDIELHAINETLNCKYNPVHVHIIKASKLLSDRNKPDYENSIKESISAVEAICKIVVGADGKEATLGNMLKKLEESGVQIHGSMKEAFQKLYGYTSGANGIRHAGDIGGPSSTFEEAKFMLVACSAFINYLITLNAD